MKEWQESVDYNFKGYMSPQFIYNNRENQNTEGMFGRDVMRILSKIGSVKESVYEYGKIEPVEDIDETYYNKGETLLGDGCYDILKSLFIRISYSSFS